MKYSEVLKYFPVGLTLCGTAHVPPATSHLVLTWFHPQSDLSVSAKVLPALSELTAADFPPFGPGRSPPWRHSTTLQALPAPSLLPGPARLL